MPNTLLLLKQREIYLRGPSEPSLDLDAAIQWLNTAQGVRRCTLQTPLTIQVDYDLRITSLQQLETALTCIGFHLDNNLLAKLKRALYYYTEDNERQLLGFSNLDHSNNCATKVFVANYRKSDHGCRDPRPEHLRHYH